MKGGFRVTAGQFLERPLFALCYLYFFKPELLLVFSCAAFSSARAPAMMLTTSLLLSLHAYSNIGPLIAAKGTMAVHGFVHVDGSLTVKVYSMRSAATRLKRSVIFKVLDWRRDRQLRAGSWWFLRPACHLPNGPARPHATGGCWLPRADARPSE